MPLLHGASLDLLSRLVRNRGRKPAPGFLAACQKVAETAVNALPKVKPRKEQSRRTGWVEYDPAKPVEATSVVSLFDALKRLQAQELRDSAAASLIARPKIYAPDAVLVPALSRLRQQHGAKAADSAFWSLWRHAAEFLLARSEFPPPEPTDWAQPVKLNCRCADCRELEAFARDPVSQVHRFRVRKDRRQHLHETIERYQLDMTHQTERIGSPQTLVCTKTRWTYEKRCQQYAQDIGHFKTLAAVAVDLPASSQSLLDRLHKAIDRAGSSRSNRQ
jgi:hypothetical protein